MATVTGTRTDVYTRVTETIVSHLEAGIRPWLKPWSGDHAAGRVSRPLRFGGEPYRGINVVMLWLSAEERGFDSPYWMTYRQAQELGGFARKGEKGTKVVYANSFKKMEEDEQGNELEREIPYLRDYTVFNANQLEGLPERYQTVAEQPTEGIEKDERLEAFFAGTGADIRVGGYKAYYAVGDDYIRMPPIECFKDSESYYATLAHEATHWTRHESRLNRDLGRKKWGDEGYAMEELVAELGAAFLSADLRITPEVREDHADYIASWLKVLKEDKRAIFSAASYASKAAEYLHGLQSTES